MDRKKFVREENVPRRRDTCFRRDANEKNIIRRSRCELCERNRTVLDAYFTGRIEKRLSRKRYLPRRRIYFIILSYHERNTIHRPRRTNRTNGISVVGASCGRIGKICSRGTCLFGRRGGRNLDEGKVEKAVSVLREPVVEPEHPTGEWNSRRRRKRVTTCFTLRVTRPRPSPPKQIYITRH